MASSARPGRTAISPERSAARPLMVPSAPPVAGIVTGVQADPPSVLSHVPYWPSAYWPEITVASP